MVKTKNFAEKIITLLFLFFFSIPALAEDKTAITEFKINAEKEFEYLQTAIPEMFFSRLPYKNKEIVKTNDIKNLFNNGFNMVITGSYTKLGNAFSLDVRVHKKDEVKSFYSAKENPSMLISAIEEIAKKIADKGEMETKVYKSQSNKIERVNVQNYKYPIYSLSIADLNGDGKKEFILASKNTLYIYDSENNKIIFEKKFPLEILIINSGDFNKNLKDEVYITTMRNEDPVTLIFEHKDKGLEQIYEEEIYVNIIEDMTGNKKLVGQKPAVNLPFDNTIYELTYDGKKLIKGEKISFPNFDNLNIYQIKPIRYKNSEYYLFVDESDYYKIIDKNGTTIERLKERYGGSTLGISRGVTNQMPNYLSLPARFYIIKDGETDAILTIKNEGSRLFLRSKKFDRGKIVILKADDLSFKEVKESELFDGYISDIALDKTENQIYISIVTDNNEGRIVKLGYGR